MTKCSTDRIDDVPIDKIDEPKGILRMDIDPDDLDDLAQSISEIGLMQPILIAVDGERFELVFGHRRWLAHQKLGLSTIRSFIRTMTQAEIGIARATENIARTDLTPIEEASTYQNLIEHYGLSIEQVAKKMGKTPGTIKRRIFLLRMPPQLQQAVHKKQISMSVAEELWPISDVASLEYYLHFAIESGCTKETARGWCKEWKDSQRRSQSPGVEGGEAPSPYEPRPTFIACDTCSNPVELGKDHVMRVCPACWKAIKQGLEVT